MDEPNRKRARRAELEHKLLRQTRAFRAAVVGLAFLAAALTTALAVLLLT